MKKYVFEADKKQWEKPTEPNYVFCPPAQVTVQAESPEEAEALAAAKFREHYLGTGTLLGKQRLVAEYDLAIDWNYGYGEGRGTGTPEERAALQAECTK